MSLPTRPRVVVTGGGSGLGRAFCLQLAKRNARLLVADVNLASAQETISMLGGTDAIAVECDVSDAAAVGELANEMDRRHGGTDLVINNAGVAVSGRMGDVPLDDWKWIMGVNLWGVIYGCHHFVPRLRAQGHGAVLNVASAAGLLSAPMMGAYNVTKAGVVALSETLYAELIDTGVHVTVLCPTFFRTKIADNDRGGDERMRQFVHKLMDRSKVQADDVARIALEAVDRKQLYALPHEDGRWMWRLKRAAPQRYFDLVGKQFKKMAPAG